VQSALFLDVVPVVGESAAVRQLLAREHEALLVGGDALLVITTIFPRIYARTYYAHPRARVMSFSHNVTPVLSQAVEPIRRLKFETPAKV
jgi:hypothetical protein